MLTLHEIETFDLKVQLLLIVQYSLVGRLTASSQFSQWQTDRKTDSTVVVQATSINHSSNLFKSCPYDLHAHYFSKRMHVCCARTIGISDLDNVMK